MKKPTRIKKTPISEAPDPSKPRIRQMPDGSYKMVSPGEQPKQDIPRSEKPRVKMVGGKPHFKLPNPSNKVAQDLIRSFLAKQISSGKRVKDPERTMGDQGAEDVDVKDFLVSMGYPLKSVEELINDYIEKTDKELSKDDDQESQQSGGDHVNDEPETDDELPNEQHVEVSSVDEMSTEQRQEFQVFVRAIRQGNLTKKDLDLLIRELKRG